MSNLTSNEKIYISTVNALLFFIFNNTEMYKLVNTIVNKFIKFDIYTYQVTTQGIVLHSLVLILFSRLIIQIPTRYIKTNLTSEEKWDISIISGLLFLMVNKLLRTESVQRRLKYDILLNIWSAILFMSLNRILLDF